MLKKRFAVMLITALNIATVSAMGNPASLYCQKLGGKSEIASYKNGDEFATCRFPNGNVYEEWTLFRMFNGQQPHQPTDPAH